MSTLSALTTTESTFEEKSNTLAEVATSTLADEGLGDWRVGWVPGLKLICWILKTKIWWVQFFKEITFYLNRNINLLQKETCKVHETKWIASFNIKWLANLFQLEAFQATQKGTQCQYIVGGVLAYLLVIAVITWICLGRSGPGIKCPAAACCQCDFACLKVNLPKRLISIIFWH